MKITGSDLIAFLETGWPSEDWRWQRDALKGEPHHDALYDTRTLGALVWQGKAADPSNGQPIPIESFIKLWMRGKATQTFSVRIPRNKEGALRDFVASVGGTIDS